MGVSEWVSDVCKETWMMWLMKMMKIKIVLPEKVQSKIPVEKRPFKVRIDISLFKF